MSSISKYFVIFVNTCQNAIPPSCPTFTLFTCSNYPKTVMLTSTSHTGVDVTFKKIYLRVFSSNFYNGEIFVKTCTPIFLDPRESNINNSFCIHHGRKDSKNRSYLIFRNLDEVLLILKYDGLTLSFKGCQFIDISIKGHQVLLVLVLRDINSY